MRPDVNFEVKIARASATRCLLALTRKADQLSLGHARRNCHADRVRLQIQRAIRLQIRTLQLKSSRSAVVGLLQIYVNPRVMIAGGAAGSAATERTAAGAAAKAAAAKQRREEVTEAFSLFKFLRLRSAALRPAAALARSAFELETTAPVRRWPECLTGFPLAAELIVGGTLLGILQDLVGLLDLLELLFRIRFSLLTSGWYLRARRRYAFLISSAVAVRAMPRIL